MLSEYMKYRCCMCPNMGNPSTTCPGIPHTPHPDPSECRYVKTYEDERGWKYFVRSGIGKDCFKAFYRKPGCKKEVGYKNLAWRNGFDKAQADLNMLAEKKGWKEAIASGR